MKRMIFIFILLFSSGKSWSVDPDRIWYLKTLSDGIETISFTKDDSIVIAQLGIIDSENNVKFFSIFVDAKTGLETRRLNEGGEVFLINNDSNFVKLNEKRTKLEIFNYFTFQKIDSIENDTVVVPLFSRLHISKDGHFIIAPITNGFRIWDIWTKKIHKTKIYKNEPGLLSTLTNNFNFSNDNSRIYMRLIKEIENPSHPGDKNYATDEVTYPGFDVNTLDSLDDLNPTKEYVNISFSPSCNLYSVSKFEKTNAIGIYDMQTNGILKQIAVNGPTLTGMEFTSDDKYLVTSNTAGVNKLQVWDVNSGELAHEYSSASYGQNKISHNDKFILVTNGPNLILKALRNGNTYIPQINFQNNLHPNPTNGLLSISNKNYVDGLYLYQISDMVGNIIQKDKINFVGGIGNTNVSKLSSGTYFLIINNDIYKFIVGA